MEDQGGLLNTGFNGDDSGVTGIKLLCGNASAGLEAYPDDWAYGQWTGGIFYFPVVPFQT